MNSEHTTPELTLIANPAAGGGRTARLVGPVREALQTRWSSRVELFVTSKRGDAFRRASHPSPGSAHVFVVLGGDGTIQEVVNGLMTLPPQSRRTSSVGVISSGTGQGLAQSLALPASISLQAEVIARGRTREIDLGLIRQENGNSQSRGRYFVNECQVGIGGDVVRRVEAAIPKRLGGRATFGLGALRSAWTHPNQRVYLDIDGTARRTISVLGLVIGNGEYTGGGMNLTRGAVLWDGQLDLLIMKAQSISRRLLNLPMIYSARHVHRDDFELLRVRHLSIRSPERVPVAADGEYLGNAPATIGLVPHALRIVVPGARS